MSLESEIVIKGAREHNLKNISISIPRHKITVLTGLSGSGKSSLAFETIYAEGHRRYIESLSNYARQFLDSMKKPDVDSITGLTPAIAIDQKSVSLNPRSTVGTVTEVYDFLRLLFAKVGIPHCPEHKTPLSNQTPQQILNDVLKLPEGTKFFILAPMAQSQKGEFLNEFQKWQKKGFVKARVDGQMIELAQAKKLAKHKAHNIDLVVDQMIMKTTLKERLSMSINTSLGLAQGRVIIEQLVDGKRKMYSLKAVCPECGFSFPELEPRLWSFNHPKGACVECKGLGTLDLIEENEFGISDEGSRKLTRVQYHLKDLDNDKDKVKGRGKGNKNSDEDDEIESSQIKLRVCFACHGSRLNLAALSVDIDKKNIAELAHMPLVDLKFWLEARKWSDRQGVIAEKILRPLIEKLDYLLRVGTGYLSVDRSVRTLSGGEAQRLRLATQVGSSLVGVLYVLDEPSIGLHPRDHQKLLGIIKELRDRGNTVILVEHDADTIRFADYVVDLGPRAGKEGGYIIANGTPSEIQANPASLTGQYLSGTKQIPLPERRRSLSNKSTQWLELNGATGNNLKNVNLKIPIGTLTVVTGVSGSGKSTLIMDTLYKVLGQHFYESTSEAEPYKEIKGLEFIDKVIDINQRPIGRTPRSIPATYVGLFPLIRDLFAQHPEAKLRGYPPGRFSFNLKGGRCENCQGQGVNRLEMHFLNDVFVTCEICQGKRYNSETLRVLYKGKSISDVLMMDVGEALDFFKNHSLIYRKLETLHQVGLDYISLGQNSTTLSGGEAQRIKLSRELSKRGTGKTLYILDEPTTGLHFEDVRKLCELLQRLVDQGNTVLIIEHNLEVIKTADYIVDLGPEGGRDGGYIIAEGPPEQIIKAVNSATGLYLKAML